MSDLDILHMLFGYIPHVLNEKLFVPVSFGSNL